MINGDEVMFSLPCITSLPHHHIFFSIVSIMIQRKPQNYLSMVPVHNVQEFKETEGKITMLIPKFKHDWLRKWLIPKHKSPFFRIHLDETGSHIWQLINGKRTVEEICFEMRGIYQHEEKAIEHLEERITQFLTGLYKKRFIIFMAGSRQ